MLRSLRIVDLALIEELTLAFGAGLNVVTGETGAGKSLLQRALALAVGHRAGAEVVRSGTEGARIEATFALPSDGVLAARLERIGVPVGERRELVVRRSVGRSGRSQVVLGGEGATLATLLEIGTDLVSLQGQHESLRLAQPETHLEMLDQASGAGHLAQAYREAWSRLGGCIARLEALERGAREIERRLELARFDLGELEHAHLGDPGEEASLERERLRWRNLERLAAVASDALDRLHAGEGAALAAVERAARRLEESATLDAPLGAIAAQLAEAAAPLGDAVRALQAYADGLEADPQRLEQIEERMALLARLERKHRVDDLAGLLARRAELSAEVERAERDAADPAALHAELEDAAARAWRLADELSALRRVGAAKLERAMDGELAALGMHGARFFVRCEALPAGPARGPAAMLTRQGAGLGSDGAERIEFDLAANPGEGARPLARVASGGELSRIMLALRHVAGGNAVPTLVFDEVDAGIGGAAAEAVGRRLQSLARRHQVICITHLAQIAAFADLHFTVAKRERDGRTRTCVASIDGQDRVAELARMLGGSEPGEAGLRHAAEMLERTRGDASAPRAGDPQAAQPRRRARRAGA